MRHIEFYVNTDICNQRMLTCSARFCLRSFSCSTVSPRNFRERFPISGFKGLSMSSFVLRNEFVVSSKASCAQKKHNKMERIQFKMKESDNYGVNERKLRKLGFTNKFISHKSHPTSYRDVASDYSMDGPSSEAEVRAVQSIGLTIFRAEMKHSNFPTFELFGLSHWGYTVL